MYRYMTSSNRDALIAAMILAITAPTEDQSRRAVRLAKSLAARLSREDILECQRDVSKRVLKTP